MDRNSYSKKMLNLYEKRFQLPDSNLQVTVIGRVTQRHKETYLYFRDVGSSLYFFMKYHEFCDFIASKDLIFNHFTEAYEKVCEHTKKKSTDIQTLPSTRKRKRQSKLNVQNHETSGYESSETEVSESEETTTGKKLKPVFVELLGGDSKEMKLTTNGDPEKTSTEDAN